MNEDLNIGQETSVKPWYKHKGLMVIVLLLFVATGVSAVYYIKVMNDDIEPLNIVHSNKNLKTIQNNSTESLIATPTPIQSNEVNGIDMSNWSSYVNDIYSIKFKYPKTLTLDFQTPSRAGLSVIGADKNKPWLGIGLNITTNPEHLDGSSWLVKNNNFASCNSDPVVSKLSDFDKIESYSDSKCIQFPNNNFPPIRTVNLVGKNYVLEMAIRKVPEADNIIASVEFLDPISSTVNNQEISYSDNSKLFQVTKKTFRVLDRFTADDLEFFSSGCFGQPQPLSYYQKVLLHFNSDDLGTKYIFKYNGKSQEGDFEVTVIPNRLSYKNMDEFNRDFGVCDAGNPLIPKTLSENYLLFTPACSTGYDDGSGLDSGCDEIQNFVEDSIKLVK